MSAYLREAPHEEAMTVWSKPAEEQPGLLAHTIWSLDFMCLGHHDVPCPICFERPAFLYRNVTPGQWEQRFHPCEPCRKAGWRILKLPRWLRRIGREP